MTIAATAPKTTLIVETVVLVAAPVPVAEETADAAASVAEEPRAEISAAPVGANTWGR